MVTMQLISFVLLLPVPAAEALALSLGGTSPMRTTPFLKPNTCSQSFGIRIIPNYSTSLHLIPKKWLQLSTPRSSNRVHSSEENVESEPIDHNTTNKTLDACDNETISTADSEYESQSLGMKSGWANFGLSLLPSWSSTTELQSDSSTSGDVNYNNTIYSNDSSALDNVDDDAIYEIELANELAYDDFNDIDDQVPVKCAGMVGKLLRYTVAIFLWGGKKLLDRIAPPSTFESSTMSFDEIDSPDEMMLENATTSEIASTIDAHDETAAPDNSLDNKQHGKSRQQQRRRQLQNQSIPPIFTSLESKDINTTTLAKHRRWARRRRRALVAYEVAKNAIFLFVVTFLAGNVSEVCR